MHDYITGQNTHLWRNGDKLITQMFFKYTKCAVRAYIHRVYLYKKILITYKWINPFLWIIYGS